MNGDCHTFLMGPRESTLSTHTSPHSQSCCKLGVATSFILFSEQVLLFVKGYFHREHISTDSSQEAEESAERCSVEIDSFLNS